MESNQATIELKDENPYAMRSMAYLQHLLYEVRDGFYEWKKDMRRMRNKGEEPSDYMANFPGVIFSCEEAIEAEIERREKLGIENPEGFCDFKDNEGAHWDWDCKCEPCQKQLEEMNAAADEWEDQCGDDDYEDPEIGNCGFPCDGHCEECDPGYFERSMYGTYDHAGEI